MRLVTCLLIIFTLIPSAFHAQDPEPLTLDRLWYSGEFRQEGFRSAGWYKDGNWYITTERPKEISGTTFVLNNCKTGKTKTLLAGEKLIPEGKDQALSWQSYEWSDDFSKVLFFGNTKRVWRTNTKGDYWLYDMKTEKLRQLGKDMPESSMMFAKLSPDHQSVAYVSDFNLYVEDIATGETRALTADGNIDIINGTFDWVYEEEFSCQDGFRWSPDGKTIAFWQVDATNIRDFYMINNTDSLYPFLVPVQYPKAGEDPSRVRVATVDVASGKRTWMDIPGDQIQNYIPRMQWVGNQVLVQQLDRHQQNLKFWMCDPASGKSKLIYEESDPAYIEVSNNDLSDTRNTADGMPIIASTGELAHVSEKDGWRHLFGIKPDGSGERTITDFDFEMASLYGIYDDLGSIYFNASPDNPTQRYLYSQPIKGGAPTRLTPDKYDGMNRYSISPNGKYAVHTHSSATQPRTIHLVSLPSHKVVRTLAANRSFIEKMDTLGYPEPEFITVTIDGDLEIPVQLTKPSDFDPSKKYPIIFYVYGEPWGQTCVDGWSFGYGRVLAEMGYIVATMDNRGTPCPRGREWRKSCYRQLGRINIADQAKACAELVKQPYIDEDRVGVWGWSGGGTTTLGLLFQYPEQYHVGIAVAPVPDLTLYDNVYQERYMGIPQETMEDYVAGSAVTHAKNLEGDLLVIHGTGDDNVHYQGTERLINELVKYNKMFSMMSYPNRSHGIWEGEGTSKHLYTMMIKYWEDHLEAGGK